MMRRVVLLLAGVLVIVGITACGKPKYKLIFEDNDFKSPRKSYEQGETVTVYYDMIATDTDYSFYCDDDVDIQQSYDNDHGYVFTFTMPDHDVTMRVESRNTMEYDPYAMLPGAPDDLESEIDSEKMVFDYFEKTVATVGGDEYTEYALYERDDEPGLILARYDKHEDEDETVVCGLVPENVLDDVMGVVLSYGMDEWKDGSGLKGKYYVVKYKESDGNIVRVSSDEMPEDGREAFYAVEEELGSAWSRSKKPSPAKDGNETTGTWFCPECGQKNEGKYCMDCGLQKPE